MTIQCQYHWLLSLRGGRVTPGFKARGRRIVHYATVIATQKLDDKDKQVGIFFDRNRLIGHYRKSSGVDRIRLI
ncbi:MAG: hypothetical protein BECKG1743D_GA0114223_109422 [Candidatus Kentron sp. G]|nr:MAG: hypothetical protein BECKG1743D_GA0114223_103592 [Candidatus Kentron sp. G]VFN06945.1 MAG: hypothetical protein BECKG1743D_GA0114223_109422 [Candidatus Kentron sp. G]